MPALDRHDDVFVLDIGDTENRFHPDWLASVSDLLDEVEQAEGPRALVTAATGKFFSNGLDLDWLFAHPGDGGQYLAAIHELLARVLALPVITVAALQGHGGDTSATTFVSAVASGYEVTLCWLGDSRAYWLGQAAAESRLLTRDDSVAGGMVAAGLADEAAAMASPHAHVLTRWLGGDAADLADDPDRAAHIERYTPPGSGALLICSDGLWNYLPEAADLAGLALPKALSDPLGAAADMVKFAVDAGGADNITVVLIPYLGPETP